MTQNNTENLGTYTEVFSAKSTTITEGQDGTLATQILISGLENGLFTAAVIAKPTTGYNRQPATAKTTPEILNAKGSVYLKLPTIPQLTKTLKENQKVALVCTPCQAKAARNLQQKLQTQQNSKKEIFIIGLFCFRAFNRQALKQAAKEHADVDIDQAQKIQIKNGTFTATTKNGTYTCKAKNLAGAQDPTCQNCTDFTAEHADLSLGSAGSPDGHTTIIIRTKKGQQLTKNLKLQKTQTDTTQIEKLAALKKQRTKK